MSISFHHLQKFPTKAGALDIPSLQWTNTFPPCIRHLWNSHFHPAFPLSGSNDSKSSTRELTHLSINFLLSLALGMIGSNMLSAKVTIRYSHCPVWWFWCIWLIRLWPTFMMGLDQVLLHFLPGEHKTIWRKSNIHKVYVKTWRRQCGWFLQLSDLQPSSCQRWHTGQGKLQAQSPGGQYSIVNEGWAHFQFISFYLHCATHCVSPVLLNHIGCVLEYF